MATVGGLAFLLLPSSPAAEPETAQNNAWLLNGDFAASTDHQTPDSWTLVRPDVLKANWFLDNQTGGSVGPALRLDAVGNSAELEQNLRRVPTRPFLLKGWLAKRGDLSRSQLVIRFYNHPDGQLLGTQTVAEASTEWTRFFKEITPPAQAEAATLSYQVDGTGQAWIDDLVLEEASDATTPTPTSQ